MGLVVCCWVQVSAILFYKFVFIMGFVWFFWHQVSGCFFLLLFIFHWLNYVLCIGMFLETMRSGELEQDVYPTGLPLPHGKELSDLNIIFSCMQFY